MFGRKKENYYKALVDSFAKDIIELEKKFTDLSYAKAIIDTKYVEIFNENLILKEEIKRLKEKEYETVQVHKEIK